MASGRAEHNGILDGICITRQRQHAYRKLHYSKICTVYDETNHSRFLRPVVLGNWERPLYDYIERDI